MADALTDFFSMFTGGAPSATGTPFPSPAKPAASMWAPGEFDARAAAARPFIGPPAPMWKPGEFDARAAAAGMHQPKTDVTAIFSSLIDGAGKVYSVINEDKVNRLNVRNQRFADRQQFQSQDGLSFGKIALISVALIGIGAVAYTVAKKKRGR